MTVTLSFDEDNAKLELKTSESECLEVSGLCEISSDEFVIHDANTSANFVFRYKVNFDSIDIMYDGGTLTLYKI